MSNMQAHQDSMVKQMTDFSTEMLTAVKSLTMHVEILYAKIAELTQAKSAPMRAEFPNTQHDEPSHDEHSDSADDSSWDYAGGGSDLEGYEDYLNKEPPDFDEDCLWHIAGGVHKLNYFDSLPTVKLKLYSFRRARLEKPLLGKAGRAVVLYGIGFFQRLWWRAPVGDVQAYPTGGGPTASWKRSFPMQVDECSETLLHGVLGRHPHIWREEFILMQPSFIYPCSCLKCLGDTFISGERLFSMLPRFSTHS